MAGSARPKPRDGRAALLREATGERRTPRRTQGQMSDGILSDYNNLTGRKSSERMQAYADFLALGWWICHRSGRRTSAWVSFSGATIPSREEGVGRCPSKWNGSIHVGDLR
jgi:hypothetical protein